MIEIDINEKVIVTISFNKYQYFIIEYFENLLHQDSFEYYKMKKNNDLIVFKILTTINNGNRIFNLYIKSQKS